MARLGLALALLASCELGDSYRCAGADQRCVLGGTRGWCEASGYCSFPAADCPSGRKYGRWAEGALASQCVDVAPDLGAGPDADSDVDAGPPVEAGSDLGGCGGELQPCCGGAGCDNGLICGAGTCFLFYDSFEGAVSSGWFSKSTDGGVTPAADTTHAYRGSGSLKVTANAGPFNWESGQLYRPSSHNPIYARAFVWMPSTAVASGDWQLMLYRNTHDTPFPQAWVGLSSSFRLSAATESWKSTPGVARAANAIPLDDWVCIEWMLRWDAAASGASVVSDNNGQVASIAPSPLPVPLDFWAIGFAGPPPATTFSFWIDDVALARQPIGCNR